MKINKLNICIIFEIIYILFLLIMFIFFKDETNLFLFPLGIYFNIINIYIFLPIDSGQDLIYENEKEMEEINHYKTMRESYGFNEEQVDTILKSYNLFEQHIEDKDLNNKEKIHEYFKNMAGLCINYSGSATRWKLSGLPSTKETINYFKEIGLTTQEISDLFALINKQHSDNNNFETMLGNQIKKDEKIILGEDFLYSKNFDYDYKKGTMQDKDFAHELVQYAIFSSDTLFVKKIGHIIGDYNNLISYKGDVFSTRMEKDDMNSDLDAINIYNLFIDSNNSFLDIMTKYNNQIINNDINRAEEFLKYFGNGNVDKGLEYVEKDLSTFDIGSHYIYCGSSIITDLFSNHFIDEEDVKNKRQEFLEYLRQELEKEN